MRWKGDLKLEGQSCGRLDLLMGLVWGLGPEVSKVTYAGQTKIGRSSGNRRRECVRPRSHQRHLFEIYSKGLVGLHMYTDSQRFVPRSSFRTFRGSMEDTGYELRLPPNSSFTNQCSRTRARSTGLGSLRFNSEVHCLNTGPTQQLLSHLSDFTPF